MLDQAVLMKEVCDPELFARAYYAADIHPPGVLFEFMAYLRHHGFPSPFLDWSRSPYVAAFFAFRDHVAPSVQNRSIYVFCERPSGKKTDDYGEPNIRMIGPQAKTHRRHFLQQSVYTVCEYHDNASGWQYVSHQKVFDRPFRDQDFLGKFDIPSTEREKVMGLLDQYNLNAYSLFESEESLLETLWLRVSRT